MRGGGLSCRHFMNSMEYSKLPNLTMGQRIGLIIFFAFVPIGGGIAAVFADWRILSSDWGVSDKIYNCIIVGQSVIFLIGLAIVGDAAVLFVKSGIEGEVHPELLNRYGKKAVGKWFGWNL